MDSVYFSLMRKSFKPVLGFGLCGHGGTPGLGSFPKAQNLPPPMLGSRCLQGMSQGTRFFIAYPIVVFALSQI